MSCSQCKLIRYSSSSSPFANKAGPFVYVLFSECVARKAYALDPRAYVFKLGFSAGGQDRFRSLIEGWRYKGGQTMPLGNCRNWVSVGTWRMQTAEAFEHKFIKFAVERHRILQPHVYLGAEMPVQQPRSNGETEIYWFNDQDFEDLPLYQDRVCTEERGNFAALQSMFDAIKQQGDRLRSKLAAS